MTALLSGVDLARAVLKAKDRYELLSLGSAEPIRVGDDGFLNVEDEDVRRVYIKMSVKIHPDKLREFPEATKAFQALVRAYELCCKPDLREDESDDSRSGGDESDDDEEEEAGDDESDDDDEAAAPEAAAPAAPRARAKAPTSYAEVDSDEDLDEDSDEDEAPKKRAPKRAPKAKAGKQPPRKKKAPTAKKKKKAPRQRRRRSTAANTRGDAAERRTGVSCPRCSSGWGDHLRGEGQEGLYTEFMRGARQVSCTSCLFEFGCLSAGHKCPDCSAPFEYRPQRFDAAFVCSRKSCGATFSVARFALSRAAKAGEADRKADESRKRKAEAASRARAERAEKLRDDDDDEAALLELGAFIVSEECPRCGKLFTSGHKKHLATCSVATKPAGKLKGAWLVGSTSSRDGDYVAKPRKPAAAKKATVSKAKKPAAAKPASKKPAARKPKKAADSDESDDDFLASDSDFDAAPRKKRPKKAAKAAKPEASKPKASKPKASKPKAAKAPVKKKIKKSDWSDSDSSFADY